MMSKVVTGEIVDIKNLDRLGNCPHSSNGLPSWVRKCRLPGSHFPEASIHVYGRELSNAPQVVWMIVGFGLVWLEME